MPAVYVARRAKVAKVAETVATRLHGKPNPFKSVESKNVAEVAQTLADRRPEELQPLWIAATGIGTMKGVVANRLLSYKRCALEFEGRGKIFQALETVLYAEEFLEDDRRPVTTPEIRDRPGKHLPLTRLHVQLLPPRPTVAGTRWRVTSGTNPRDFGRGQVHPWGKVGIPGIGVTSSCRIRVTSTVVLPHSTTSRYHEVLDVFQTRRTAWILWRDLGRSQCWWPRCHEGHCIAGTVASGYSLHYRGRNGCHDRREVIWTVTGFGMFPWVLGMFSGGQ